MRRIASIPTGGTTYDFTYALGAIWMTNRSGGTVQRITPNSNRVLKTVAFPAGVAPAGIGYAAGALWVGDDHGNSVFRLEPRTYRWTRVRSGGQAASWIAVNGTDVWVSNTKSGTVTRIDARTRKATATLKIGISPVNLDAIGGDIWVPDDLADTIVRVTAIPAGSSRRSRPPTARRWSPEPRATSGRRCTTTQRSGGSTRRRDGAASGPATACRRAGHDRRGRASLPAPSIAGPRQTTSQEPVYTFGAKGAARYVCAFDSTRLHACPSPYSEWLTVGTHVLRVQAVGSTGRSPVGRASVGIVAPSGLYASARVEVGDGAGVPAVTEDAVWVPNTRTGTVTRVNARTSKVVTTIKLGVGPAVSGLPRRRRRRRRQRLGGTGHRWRGGPRRPRTNRLAERIKVESRPGGLTAGGGYVWAFHFEGDTVTRIDATTGTVKAFRVPGLLGTGIAYAEGAAWLLTEKPSQLSRSTPRAARCSRGWP